MSRIREAPPGAPVPGAPVPAPAAAQRGAPHAGMSAFEWTILFTLSLIWGGSFFFNKILLGTFEPLTIVLGRVGIAAIALVIFLHAGGGRLPRSWAIWR